MYLNQTVINPFNKYLLSIYYMQRIVFNAWNVERFAQYLHRPIF